jgi:phosphinothricin acetyltransferase
VIRSASVADAAAIAAIYAPCCTNSAISFEEVPPSIEEMSLRIAATLERYPWLVFDRDREILGYAYAHSHRVRPAYRWTAEVSCYVRHDHHRRGIGRLLYAALFEMLIELGYYRAVAGVTLPNSASVALHESLGFTPVGVYHRIGYKLGEWHDTGWWEKELQPARLNPPNPRQFSKLNGAT